MKQHRFKNFVALFLVFVLVVGLLPIEDATVDAWAGTTSQQSSNTVRVGNWAELQAALGGNDSVIELTKDIRAGSGDSGLVVTGSAITINLNGLDIDRGLDQSVSSATGAGFVLKVASGASVTITGSMTQGEIKGGNNSGFGGGIVVEGGGKLTLGNVLIGGNKAPKGKGVGVYLATGAALTLDGLVTMGGDESDPRGYSDIFLNGGKITLGDNFQSGSKVYVSCAVGDTIFSEKITAEKAKGIYAYKADDPEVRLAYDIYRNAFYLPGKVTQAPTAITGLTYNKTDQTLINAGTASGGAIYYKKTDKDASQPEFIDELGNVVSGWVTDASHLKGKDAGTYRIWYAVKGDDSYCTVDPACVDVDIAKADLNIQKNYDVSVRVYERADYTVDLTSYESVTYSTISSSVSNLISNITVDNNKLSFSTASNSTGKGTSTAITIRAKKDNYNEVDVKVTVVWELPTEQQINYDHDPVEKGFGAEPFITQIPDHAIGTVTYSSSNESVATVDSRGEVTIKGVGETTITAVASGNENYNPKTISYTLRVTKGKPVITPLEASTNLTFSPTATGSAIGYEQPLLEKAGIVSGGAIYYAVTDANATTAPAFDADNIDTNVWSSDIPKRSNAGTYKVWYAVKGDENHVDIVANRPVEVTIAKARHPYNGVSSLPLVVLSNSPQTNVIRLTEDDITIDFKYVETSLDDHGADNSSGLVDSAEIIVGEDGRRWVSVNTLGNSDLCTHSYGMTSKVAVLINAGDNYEEFWGYLPVIAGAIKFDGGDVSVEYGNNNNTYTKNIYGDTDAQAAVKYRVKECDPASAVSVDERTGKVTINAIGETGTKAVIEAYIEATAIAGYTISEQTATYTFTVRYGMPGFEVPVVKQGKLKYDGAEHELINAGSATNGTMYYKLVPNEETPNFINNGDIVAGWTTDASEIKAKDAGTYKIFYAVKGDNGYIDRYDSSSNFVTVEIVKAKLNLGTGSHSKEVLIEEAKQGYTVELPELGNDLTYGTPTVSGQVAGLISGARVSGHTLKFDTTSQVASSSAIIVIPVNVGNNYENCEVNVTVTASVQSDQTITVGADEVNKVYGEASFKNEISGAKTTLTYKVTSGQDVVSVADDGTITIRGIGEARISVKAAGTAKYREATANFKVKVSKANSEVTKLPAAVEKLEAGSEAQKLIVEGEAKGGKLLYAVSLNKDEKPDANAYAEEIPEGTAAGIYYVYFMVKGNEYYEDYVPTDALTVEIKTPQVTPDPVDPSGSGSGSNTESGSTESGSVTEKTEEKKENDKENKNEDETPVVEPEVIKNEDGSTTTKTVEENEDGSTTTKEETQTSDGTTVTKEETVLADGSVIAKEEEVSTDGTVTTREETKNAKGEGTATVIKADADGNVLSETQETTKVNKKGSVTVETVTENADGSTVESTVKTTKSGNVTATIIEKDADGSVTTTNETVKNLSSGAVKTTTETVETDAEGNVVATVEKTVKVAKTDEEGNTKTTATVKSTDAAGNVTTTKETVVVDAKGKASVSSVTTSTDGTKEEKSFSVSSKGTVKMAALETNAKEVEIPKTIEVGGVERPVTSISKNAMKGNKNVTSVEIGENITSIGAGAFKNSKNLSTIELTDSITKISANAFKGIAKNATFKIKASSQEEFDRIVALLKDSGVSDTVTFEMA